ncbi:MAG: RICIN domain-containing protein, partial [Eggerthellaceae bacterium]|nr:RICIN domain-containing protein [Eggerthellaceae bacterium]
MKAQPKLLSVLLSLILAIGLMPLPAFAGDAIVAGDSEILAETLATQSAAHTQAEAVAWAQARANEHWEINDGSGWTQCTEFVWAYYDYLRGGHVGGHAYNYLSDSYGACPYSEGWTRPATSTVQPGDIVIWDANKNFRADWTDYAGNVGHIGVVISVNGNSMVTAESNAGEARGACGYKYNREVSCISGLIRPDWPGDTRTIPTGSEMSSGYDRTIPNGDYAIVMSSTLTADRLYYLDISGADYPAADLTNISIYSTTGKPQDLPGCDLWSVKYQDGFYTITQKGTGISLDVNGGSVNIDSNVQACFSNGTPAQRWAISKNGDGYRLQAKCSGYSLDVEGGTVADGTNVQVHSSNDTAAQSWSF